MPTPPSVLASIPYDIHAVRPSHCDSPSQAKSERGASEATVHEHCLQSKRFFSGYATTSLGTGALLASQGNIRRAPVPNLRPSSNNNFCYPAGHFFFFLLVTPDASPDGQCPAVHSPRARRFRATPIASLISALQLCISRREFPIVRLHLRSPMPLFAG